MGSLRCVAEYLDDVCREWLGYALPPPAEVIEIADWAHDRPDAYCRRCGESVGRGEATDAGCAACYRRALPYRATVRLGPYAAPLDQWIVAIKYQRWAVMAEALGRMLAEQVECAGVIDPGEAIVVSMPMPWQRRLYRGIDHAGVLAKSVARAINAPMIRPLVRRNGRPQVGCTGSERQRGTALGLSISPWWRNRSLHRVPVVLVDDVRTTGTSLQRAARLLRSRQAGDIVCAVVAAADDTRRRRDRKSVDRADVATSGSAASDRDTYIG